MARKSPATKTTKRSLPRRLRGIPNSEVRFAHDIPRVRPTIRAEVSPVADSQEDFASDVPPDAGSSGDTPTAYNATRQRGNPLWDSYSRVDAQVAPSGFQQYATQRQDDRYGSYLAAASAENDLPQYAFQTEGDGQNPQAYRTPYAWDPTDSAGQDLRTFNDYDGHLVDNSTSRFVGPEFAKNTSALPCHQRTKERISNIRLLASITMQQQTGLSQSPQARDRRPFRKT